jgi:hypothetical protein
MARIPEMNGSPELRRRDVLLAALALLGGCGGVDSGGTGTGASSTYASGPITGFGSIIVNGVRYDDSAASIEDDDGRLRSRDELGLGMRTEVIASAITTAAGVARATASSIRVQSAIVGPLEAIDTAQAMLTVLGQTVAVVATTWFDNSITGGIASLKPGDILEVHAALDVAAGRYVASRIERRDSVGAYKLRGAVGSLSLDARTITLGGLTIDWSAAAPADPRTTLAPGRLVRVTLAMTPVAGVWRATALAGAQPIQEDREFAEVEGRITAFTSSTTFALDGLPVDASGTSVPAGLALGVQVEVKGSLRGGVLVASRVELEAEGGDAEGFELHGGVESVDPIKMRCVVRGVTVMWDANTEFEGGGAADIKVGREVEVKGRLSTDGSLIEATSIHLET